VKNQYKFLAIGLALVLLLVWQGSFTKTEDATAVTTITQDTVEWLADATSDPALITHYKPGTGSATTAAAFFIADNDLQTTVAGSSTWTFTMADNAAGVVFTIPNGLIGGSTGTTIWKTFSGPIYSTSTSYDVAVPANTPLTADPTVTVTPPGGTVANMLVTTGNLSAGTFTLINTVGMSSTVAASYNYHIVDSYARVNVGATVAATNNRAKVTSTSDSVGEWVTISEVASVGSTTANSTAKVFRGGINIGTDAGWQASDDGAIWVQDGDTLTVTYYKADHVTAIDTDTAVIDISAPTVSLVVPADGSTLNETSPSMSFTVEDAGSGLSANTPTTNIDVFINGCRVQDAELTFPYRAASKVDVVFTLSPSAATWATTPKAGSTAAITCNEATRTQSSSTTDSTLYSGFGVNTTDLGNNGHGTAFQWKITATDQAGNVKTVQTTSLDLAIDTVAPDMTTAKTGIGWNASTSKVTTDLKGIQVTFNESLDATTVSADDFLVDGVTPLTAVVGGVNVTGGAASTQLKNELVYLGMADTITANSRPKIEVKSVSDVAGNALKPATGKTIADTVTQADDGIYPTITAATSDAQLLAAKGTAKLTFTSDEALTNTVGSLPTCTCLSITGPNAATSIATSLTGVKNTVSLTTPTSATSTFTVTSLFDKTGNYGLIVNARDQFANAKAVGYVKVTDEVVSDQVTGSNIGTSIAVQLDKWPIADVDADGTLADEFSVELDGTAVTTTATAIDWTEAEKVTLTLGTAATAAHTVTVTYNYVTADQSVEVDLLGPGISFKPANLASTENKTPFIVITADEDEYAGDSYKTVTVTKATLTDPAAVATDISASLTTSDNIVFTYLPAADLALGEYTITASMKDTAGNETKDQTSKFTVAARAKRTIPLAPGWNLISLPAEPISSAINDVVTVADVTTVLTYDPSVPGGWLTAVRDDAGALSGTLTTLDASRAYWVYTKSDLDLSVDIPGMSIGAAVLPPSIPIVKGWNLVPALSLASAFTGAAGTELDSDRYFTGLTWTRGYMYDTTAEAMVGFVPTSASLTDPGDAQIKYGLGYWVYARAAGTLVP